MRPFRRSRRDTPKKQIKTWPIRSAGLEEVRPGQRNNSQDIGDAPSEVSIVESELDLERTCLLVKPFCVSQILDLCDVTRSSLRKRQESSVAADRVVELKTLKHCRSIHFLRIRQSLSVPELGILQSSEILYTEQSKFVKSRTKGGTV